jgi:hypothetical protein
MAISNHSRRSGWGLTALSFASLALLGSACGGTEGTSNDGQSGAGASAGAGAGAVTAGASGSSSAGAPSAGSAGTPASGGAPGASGAGSTAGSAGQSGGNGGGAAGAGGSGPASIPPSGAPATVLLDGAQLKKTQTELAGGTGGSAGQRAAYKNLIAAADIALKSGTWSVTTKPKEFVLNNDPHEYVSWSPYFWPSDAKPPNDTGTFGKCPYVAHDGMHNPDVSKVTDRHGLHASSEAIFELALAWYLTGNDAYADQAELVARTWYLNPATAMNPGMTHAQSNGPCGNGTATGVIEASGAYLTDALDGLAILALDTRATGWTATDQSGMKAWLTKFVDFLKTSSQGKGENNAANNHGTWFDALLASIYLYQGDADAAKTLILAARAKRIDPQIESDGRMPLELARPTSWHYSNYNASAFCRLASVGQRVGVDLWSYTNPKGGSITKSITYMIPAATSKSPPGPWSQYNDITKPFDAAYQAEVFYSLHAAAEYGKSTAAAALFTQMPLPVSVPGHYCAGDRFPLGSDFCAITPGAMPFTDLQPLGTDSIDMWPLIPVCRVPIN